MRAEFEGKFGKTVYEGYGATETTPVASVNIPDAMDTTDWKIQVGNKPGSVGMPLPGTSFRVVDPDTMDELALGTDGLIIISGNQIMLGYLNDEERTAEAIVQIDGMRWYKTGDKGHLTDDGFLVLVDRYSRFAKIGGEMISLAAVEGLISTLLDGLEVEIAATAIADPGKGEKIVLLVAGDIEVAEIRSLLQTSDLEKLSRPREIYKVDQLPKLGSGKMDLADLKHQAMEISEATT